MILYVGMPGIIIQTRCIISTSIVHIMTRYGNKTLLETDRILCVFFTNLLDNRSIVDKYGHDLYNFRQIHYNIIIIYF